MAGTTVSQSATEILMPIAGILAPLLAPCLGAVWRELSAVGRPAAHTPCVCHAGAAAEVQRAQRKAGLA
eukprot:1049610-Pyramimonas_sp.AAC.1